MIEKFDPKELKKLYRPETDSSGEENGQVTIIGGSTLFHGAPLLSLKVASRIMDMVFFASPEGSLGEVTEQIKSKLLSFIWVPWEDVEKYIEKSDAILIGPGFMRFASEKRQEIRRNEENLSLITYRLSQSSGLDEAGKLTRDITEKLLTKYPKKKWVIDAGSLQTMNPEWIPEGAILTPNRKEFELLFKNDLKNYDDSKPKAVIHHHSDNGIIGVVQSTAGKYKCVVVYKVPETVVSDGSRTVVVRNGNAGLTKGGTGDVQAGLTVALLAKNDPFLAACAGSYITKAAADELFEKVGTNYNADDLAAKIPEVLYKTQLDLNGKS